jgi:hypothetical protein
MVNRLFRPLSFPMLLILLGPGFDFSFGLPFFCLLPPSPPFFCLCLFVVHQIGTGPPGGLQLASGLYFSFSLFSQPLVSHFVFSSGRYLIPAYHSTTPNDNGLLSTVHIMVCFFFFAHPFLFVFLFFVCGQTSLLTRSPSSQYSDDQGKTWQLGGSFSRGLDYPVCFCSILFLLFRFFDHHSKFPLCSSCDRMNVKQRKSLRT